MSPPSEQLAGNSGYHFQLLTAVIEVNELQKRRTISKLKKHLGTLVGKEIALLGVAFKPDTDDIREATSLVLAGRLQGEGANVRAVPGGRQECRQGARRGPWGEDLRLGARRAPGRGRGGACNGMGRVQGARFGRPTAKRAMKTPLVVDGRNFLDREAMIAAGFEYEGGGR